MSSGSEAFPYADIIILALVAGFILLRLRSVLGNKTGSEKFGQYFMKPAVSQSYEPVIQLDEKSLKPKPKDEPDTYAATISDSKVTDAIDQIKAKDATFTGTRFLQGARGAFEMVFDAFVKGDRQTLKMLMAEPVFQHFSNDLDTRDALSHGRKTETTLVSVVPKDITEASLINNVARLTVHFLSEQVTVVRNEKNEIIEGNPSDITHVEDHWVFERDLTSKNPNWKIIET